MSKPSEFNLDVFEKAADLMARQLALFRDDCAEPTENEKLMAGHLAGHLSANGLLVSELPANSPFEQQEKGSDR